MAPSEIVKIESSDLRLCRLLNSFALTPRVTIWNAIQEKRSWQRSHYESATFKPSPNKFAFLRPIRKKRQKQRFSVIREIFPF